MSLFDRTRDEIEAMLDMGAPLEAADRVIRDAPLGDDERTRLWLMARSLDGRRRPRLRPYSTDAASS